MATSIFDVVVYGDTSAAVTTAIQSARFGRSVALISPNSHIGGIQVEGLGGTDIDNQPEVHNSSTLGGLALEFHRRISTHYNRLARLEEVLKNRIKDVSVWFFEPRVAEDVIKAWLAELPNIAILKGRLSEEDNAVTRDGTRLVNLRLSTGQTVAGKVFVDASYEGDLLASAGISTTWGRESTSTYNETLAGVREHTWYRQIEVPVDPYVVPGDASSGLIYGVSPEPFGTPGDGDQHLPAFSFRVTLTDDKKNMLPIYKPEGYEPAHFELHRRYAKAGGQFFLPNPRLPGRKTDLIGSEAPLATDLLGMNDGWVEGGAKGREQILKEAERFTKGLLYFFTSDEGLEPSFRAKWSAFGYPLDEYPDNNHFPRQLYVRAARRLVSPYVITEHVATVAASDSSSTSHGRSEPQPSDPVAVAFWPLDTHCTRRILSPYTPSPQPYNEGFIFKIPPNVHRWRPFGISLRSLLPNSDEAINLITPTCPSSSLVGYGAVRLEHQFHALGQACGIVADKFLKMDRGSRIQDVRYEGKGGIRETLIELGCVLDADGVGEPDFGE